MQKRSPGFTVLVVVLAFVVGIPQLIGAGYLGLHLGRAIAPGGTASEESSGDDSSADSGLPETSNTVEDFYSQKVTWSDCEPSQLSDLYSDPPSNMEDYRCAQVLAPLDWSDPEGETITLSLAIHAGRNSDGQALFFNLGGPGGSSVDSLPYVVDTLLGADLVDAYDVVALDPRGVGASTPVRCLSDEERDAREADADAVPRDQQTTEEIIAAAVADSKSYAAGCEKHTGDLYKYIDTVSVAKDFDMVRAALGHETMNYIGFSYGTFLGATFADLFPDKVGRFVLDGAVDPAANVNEVYDAQMRGFEESVQHWLEDCLTSAQCPFTGTKEEAISQLVAFLDRLEESPMETSDPDRPLTQNLALTSIIGAMYSTETYSVLTLAITPAIEDNDGSMMLRLADILNERDDDGTYGSTGSDALVAVNNLDFSPVGTPEEWASDAAALEKELPIMGRFAGWASAGLAEWPTTHAERRPISAQGAPPIVVVGTTHDPATPYQMAEALADQLSSGVLVSWQGWEHTAYSRSGSTCVAEAVEGYLLDGTVPENGLMCVD